MEAQEIMKKIEKLTTKELKALDPEEVVEMAVHLNPEQIIYLSGKIGYPYFERMVMGPLRHKFVLLQNGAAAIIVNNKGDILLQSRADRDQWGLPGGCQEVGERFEDVVVREVLEETNLVVEEKDLELIKVMSGPSRRNSYPNGDIVYNNTVLYCSRKYSGDLKWDNESKKMEFYSLDHLPENLMDKDLIEAYTNSLKKGIK